VSGVKEDIIKSLSETEIDGGIDRILVNSLKSVSLSSQMIISGMSR